MRYGKPTFDKVLEAIWFYDRNTRRSQVSKCSLAETFPNLCFDKVRRGCNNKVVRHLAFLYP